MARSGILALRFVDVFPQTFYPNNSLLQTTPPPFFFFLLLLVPQPDRIRSLPYKNSHGTMVTTLFPTEEKGDWHATLALIHYGSLDSNK